VSIQAPAPSYAPHPHDRPLPRSPWRIQRLRDGEWIYEDRRWVVMFFVEVGTHGVWTIRHWCATWERARDWLVAHYELGRWWSL